MNFPKLLFIILFIPFPSSAQKYLDRTPIFSVSPAIELLRSTHGTIFYGPSLKLNHLYKNGWESGVGLEYAATPLHHDNGYVLSRLKFVPVYGNLKYNFKIGKKLKTFAESSLGISFNKYDIADGNTPNNTKKKEEKGFYLYDGGGIKYSLVKGIIVFSGIGFKGYKMSKNDMDVNPHGLSFLLGCTFL